MAMSAATPISISVNFDSLNEAFGFPKGFTDPSFFRGFDRVVELLAKRGLTATFFVIGRDLEDPETRDRVRAWHRAGFEIGNHSYSHPMNLGALQRDDIAFEVERSHALIAETTGDAPEGFIAPSWSNSRALVEVLMRLGYTYDTSHFPSAMLLPLSCRVALNHRRDKDRWYRAIHRKDWLAWATKPRLPFRVPGQHDRENDLIVFPLPSRGRFTIPNWHTKGFFLGWDRHYRELEKLAATHPYLYYLIHPGDFVGAEDLEGSPYAHSLERMSLPLKEKLARLDEAFSVLAAAGREARSMAGMARHFANASAAP